MQRHEVAFDLEVTNRCNADCTFCPRAATPHQGLMSPEVFDKTLERVAEFSAIAQTRSDATATRITLCGLGEPLLNKHTPQYTRRVREAGFDCWMSSNAALLDERRGRALLDAGLQKIDINCGEIGEDYERVYDLPFERTRDNILRFAEMAGDDCEVQIIIVDHRRDPRHMEQVRKYWEAHGIEHFYTFGLGNRGGALTTDTLNFDAHEYTARARTLLARHTPSPICELAYKALVVGYDGVYYLCCSDWRKQVPMGSVFERSFLDTFDERSGHMSSSASLCAGCSTDPVNRVALELRDRESDDERPANMQAAIIAETCNEALAFLDDLGHSRSVSTRRGRTIAVRAE